MVCAITRYFVFTKDLIPILVLNKYLAICHQYQKISDLIYHDKVNILSATFETL